MRLPTLEEVDGLEIHVIVNDEIDFISHSGNDAVTQSILFDRSGGGISDIPEGDGRGGAEGELRMSNLCCGALGLSLLITVAKGDEKRSLLFDTGPEGEVWERNVTRLHLDLAAVEHIHLSHWHRDHSGGMLTAISMISEAKGKSSPVSVGVHPSRPEFRGSMMHQPISLEADPTFEEIANAGAEIVKSSEAHTVLGDLFLVSGEIPRLTNYELGLPRGIRFVAGEWVRESHIMDERFVMVNLKGKGIVAFTGCSHAGVVNVARHAVRLGGGVPLYAIVGGYHLADGKPDKLEISMADLKALDPKLLMPGHCTGWRFKYRIEQEMPGRLVPLFGGVKYTVT